MSETKQADPRPRLLTSAETAAVIEYFRKNPNENKLSRHKVIEYNDQEINLPYSVVFLDNQYFALYRGYRETRYELHLNDRSIADQDEFLKNKLSTKNKLLKFGEEIGYLGTGNYGDVKRCQNIETGEDFAIKIPFEFEGQQKNDYRKTLEKEATIQKQAEQYNTHGMRKDNKIKGYLITPIILGKELGTLIDNDHYLKKQELTTQLTIAKNILEATQQQVHEKNLIHLDLGSLNIMLDPKTNKVTIIDFEKSAKILPETQVAFSYTQYVDKNERAHYCPPELRFNANESTLRGERQQVTTKADIYSLGFLFQFDFQLLFEKHKDIMRVFNTLINNMLQQNPEKRPTIKECIEQINLCLMLAYLKKSDAENAKTLLVLLNPESIAKAQTLLQYTTAATILNKLQLEIVQPKDTPSQQLNHSKKRKLYRLRTQQIVNLADVPTPSLADLLLSELDNHSTTPTSPSKQNPLKK